MPDEPMVPVLVNRRWTVLIPEFRAIRPGWSSWERQRLAYMHAVIRPGDVVWEVGAENGENGVLFAQWGARVVLVEPDAGWWPNLRAIFDANGVQPTEAFHAYVDAQPSGHATGQVWPDCADGPLSGDRDDVTLADKDEVPRVTLDDLLAHHDMAFMSADRPDVVSIDIEGAEYQALLGAIRLLEEVRPILFVSVHPEHLRAYGGTPDDVSMHLELQGYDVQHLAYDHECHILAKPLL